MKNGSIKKNELTSYRNNEFTDFLTFDGNAQGLRVVAKLQGDDGRTGLNLTYGLLAAYLKYVSLPQNTKQFDQAGRYKKPGFFNTEKELVLGVWSELGLEPEHRFALSYIMEAADDIAYCLSDIEDGIEKGILSEKRFFEEIKWAWNNVAGNLAKDERNFLDELVQNANKSKAIDRYTLFKTSLINCLVKYAADVYCIKHADVVIGMLDGLIRSPSKEYAMLKAVRDVVGKVVFQSSHAESIELAGYGTIKGLFDQFSRLLECDGGDLAVLAANDGDKIGDRHLDYERRLFNRISPKARKAYKVAISEKQTNCLEEWHLRTHMLVDYISGMTDDFALETYQLLAGIHVEA
jgi:dGTPase